MAQLIKGVFEPNTTWRVKFDDYDTDELTRLIVAYKASKDYIKKYKDEQLDAKNTLFSQLLIFFNESYINTYDITVFELFYVCRFASQYSSLHHLKNTNILN